jgi:hypothetical protein
MAARLKGPKTGRVMEISTDQPVRLLISEK